MFLRFLKRLMSYFAFLVCLILIFSIPELPYRENLVKIAAFTSVIGFFPYVLPWFRRDGYYFVSFLLGVAGLLDMFIPDASETTKNIWVIVLASLFTLYCLSWWVEIYSKDPKKKCEECDSRNLTLEREEILKSYWQFPNKDGSRDMRYKDNAKLSILKTEHVCDDCGAVTQFVHLPSSTPSPKIKIDTAALLKSKDK